MEFTYSYLFRMISHEMKQKADQKLEQFDITNEQGHTLGLSLCTSTRWTDTK